MQLYRNSSKLGQHSTTDPTQEEHRLQCNIKSQGQEKKRLNTSEAPARVRVREEERMEETKLPLVPCQ